MLDEVAAGPRSSGSLICPPLQGLLAEDEAKLKSRKANLHQVFMQRFSNHVQTPGTKKTVDGIDASKCRRT